MRTLGFVLLMWCLLPITMGFGKVEGDLEDLSGQVVPLVSASQATSFMEGGELFSDGSLTSRSDVHYTVRVKNQTGDPIVGSSLILVIEQVMEEARIRDVTSRLEFLGSDGHTEEGKPFYRVPIGDKADLPPFGTSEPIHVQIRNPNLLRLAPPTFGIFGIRRSQSKQIENLRRILIEKGILTAEEAADIFDIPSPQKTP